ncbi:hypothetical protein Pst134EA_003279 [Puccinia striiformis f. sp. tritici]|uniref:hypothetical protein n=1 Tax=Puccinia striiformis f. sp. tritici TaxID=168172 RepID=UPI002008617C|nr:hypothetical protein Pst134EA_003279 [Puccinia striiformis f. sp. tritici]KAH9472675.1 hypothetical protein Pst134EA_003279 [Puccinia striiformis f. sp. tritici]KAI9611467.1 hypothetical protein H4Q26_008417 [Puccinia striiformis f. sp. tritici PST-130]
MYVQRLQIVWALLAHATPKLDSIPGPTTLSLPKPQHPNGVCYQGSQAKYGPTVGRDGKAIKYGSDEDIAYGRDPKNHVPGNAIWGRPTITLSNGTTCCDSLSQVREYIDYLDKTILDFFAIRQQFVVEAGRFKESKTAVRSSVRAVKVVENAVTAAEKNGFTPWVANATWTTALNSFTALELCLFDEDVKNKNYAPGPN